MKPKFIPTIKLLFHSLSQDESDCESRERAGNTVVVAFIKYMLSRTGKHKEMVRGTVCFTGYYSVKLYNLQTKKNEKTFKYLICNNLSKLIIFRVYKHSSFELQCQAFIICTANHTSLISSLHISTQLYIVLGVLHSCPQFVVPAF